MGTSELDQIKRLRSITLQLVREGSLDEALRHARTAHDLARRHFFQHPVHAEALDTMATLLYRLGNYADAERFLREAVDINRKSIGEHHPAYAENLNNLAVLCHKVGNGSEAESLYRQALEIRRATVGEGSPVFATTLNNLAELYKDRGDYETAECLLQQALQIVRASVIGEGPRLALALLNLGGLYEVMGKYEKAEPLLRQALEMMEKEVGPRHPDFAPFLIGVGSLNEKMGKHQEAERQQVQAGQIVREALGENHLLYASILSRLGGLYREGGDYDRAESHFSAAQEIVRKTCGEKHESYAAVLTDLGLLRFMMNDLAAAEPLLEQALEIKSAALGERHPDFASGLRNLAVVLDARGINENARGFSDTAELLYRQALSIWKETVGAKHRRYANCLNDLGVLYRRQEEYEKASLYYHHACGVWREIYGRNHPMYATSLHNLAGAYDAMGDYRKAELWYEEACEIMLGLWGKSHPSYAGCLRDLAGLYVTTDRPAKALPLMQQCQIVDERLVGQVFSFTSVEQRLAYLRGLQDDLYCFLSLVLYHAADLPTAESSAFDLVLRRKAIVAECSLLQREAALAGKYPEIHAWLKELTTLRGQIARRTLAGAGSEDPQAHQVLAQWTAEKERLEAEFARQIPELNIEQKLRSIDRQVVAMALAIGATLVEFVRFDVFDFKAVPARNDPRWKAAHYLVFVMRAGEPNNLQLIDLGEAEPIDRMIVTFRSAITSEEDEGDQRGLGALPSSARGTTGDDVGLRLRGAIFDPLLKAIGNRRRLMISPDGDLSRLPFDVLPTDDGRRLIDDYRISYLSAGRDVVRFQFKSDRKPSRSLVAADPDFDLGARAMTAEGGGSGRRSRDFKRGVTQTFQRLPGTRSEGKNIAAMLDAELWTEGEVLDARLKQCQSPRILHLATHGFFLEDQKRDPNAERFGSSPMSISENGMQRLADARFENPLLRSGLALAGVNTWLEKGELMEEAEDGLLTAEDVSGLDLLDTELVVLSACDTGLGEVHVGEGVFGLQRAFVLAGAKTLVMSLWEVPDEQTRELMEDFYHRILAGEPRADALREAQLGIKAKHPQPYYWGAFICQGDPGPLGAA